MRRFMQTFVLASSSAKKYYVHNDIFRYQVPVLIEFLNLLRGIKSVWEFLNEHFGLKFNQYCQLNSAPICHHNFNYSGRSILRRRDWGGDGRVDRREREELDGRLARFDIRLDSSTATSAAFSTADAKAHSWNGRRLWRDHDRVHQRQRGRARHDWSCPTGSSWS